MDEATHNAWWPLHLRYALGETLRDDEREAYEAGLKQLQSEEVLQFDEESARKIREDIAGLMAEREELLRQNNRVQAEIKKVESALRKRKRHPIGVSG